MKSFQINDTTHIECETKNTKNGFKHTATLFVNGQNVGSASASYLNRTWESYEYETVLNKLLEKSGIIPKDQIPATLKALGENSNDGLKLLATVAKMGDIFGETIEEKNAWKKRMLSTNPLISFPDDFDQLPEEEKQSRLDGALEMLDKKVN